MTDRIPPEPTRPAPRANDAPTLVPASPEVVTAPVTRSPAIRRATTGGPPTPPRDAGRPSAHHPANILALQRTVGNSSVQRLLRDVEDDLSEVEYESFESVEEESYEPSADGYESSEASDTTESPGYGDGAAADGAATVEEMQESLAEDASGAGAAGEVESGGGWLEDTPFGPLLGEEPGEEPTEEPTEPENQTNPDYQDPEYPDYEDPVEPEPEDEPDHPLDPLPQADSLIVEDTLVAFSPGQLPRSIFLGRLRETVTATANDILFGAGWTIATLPTITSWFDRATNRSAAEIESAIKRSVPEASGASSADDYIAAINGRVARAVQHWSDTGEVESEPGDIDFGDSDIPILVQFKRDSDGAISQPLDDPRLLQARLGEGQPLDVQTQSRMSDAFGDQFGAVKIHTDADAAGLASNLGARAFAVGDHIAFGANEYAPGAPAGDALLAHELAHVVQQRGADPGKAQFKGPGGEVELEADADRSAAGAVAALWGGAKGALGELARNVKPALRAGLRLQSCKGLTGPTPPTSAEVKAAAEELKVLLRDPFNNHQQISAKIAAQGSFAGHILMQVGTVTDSTQMTIIGGAEAGPAILQQIAEALRNGDYKAFADRIDPTGKDSENKLERDNAQLIANQLDKTREKLAAATPEGTADEQSDLARLNAAVNADPRLPEYKKAGLKLPFVIHPPGLEHDGGAYYSQGIVMQGVTTSRTFEGSAGRPVIFYMEIGSRALRAPKNESEAPATGPPNSDDFIRSAVWHEFQHFKQYIDFRDKAKDSDTRVSELKLDESGAGGAGKKGPSAEVEATSIQIADDIANLKDDGEVRQLLGYLADSWNETTDAFRDRAIAVMTDANRPLGAADRVQRNRVLRLIKAMKLHVPGKKPSKNAPARDLATLFQALSKP